MRLNEVVKSCFENLRVFVFEYYGKEGADGHHLPSEEENDEVLRGEEYEKSRQSDNKGDPVEC